MELEIEGGLRVAINEKYKTASIIRSPKATGIVLIPRFAKYKTIEYPIISIDGYSFKDNYIELLTFPEDSEVESFNENSLVQAHIKKLRFPPKLKYLKNRWCQFLYDLTDIEISPKNQFYIYFEHKYLLGKSQENSDKFDSLYFIRRDIENAVVPSQVKTVKYLAFNDLKKLKTVIFPSDSELECIESWAFNKSAIEKLEISSKSVRICSYCFNCCAKLSVVSFPNAESITFDSMSIKGINDKAKILIRRGATLAGSGAKDWESRITYIEEAGSFKTESPKAEDKKESLIKKEKSEITTDNGQKKDIESLEKENATLKEYAKYLQKRLSRYEESLTYEEFLEAFEKGKSPITTDKQKEEEEEGSQYKVRKRDSIVGPEDEEFQEVVSKIGEGATSEVFKVIDKRTGEVMCKKVIKECDESVAFKTLQNSVKEIETVQSIHHPCICESFGYNMQEELPRNKEDGHKDDSEEDEDDDYDKEKVQKTTIALFFEFLPFTVKEMIEKCLMSNTLKVRIAVEVAFGMFHIHSLGMMHRDLKLENIMMNCVFESKIIDFGLVHVSEISGSSSLTKGIGTLAYMSPEMVNEEDYDNKTDVYSYGIVLFALFTGRLPKQSMRDKMNNVPMKYPSASAKTSDFCINLIKKCTSFKASSRPTFDEIIEDMFVHSFSLAPEVDTTLITRRYRELNRLRRTNRQLKT